MDKIGAKQLAFKQGTTSKEKTSSRSTNWRFPT